MKALGIYLKMDQITQLIQRIDKDGSGVVEFDEFMALMAEKIVKLSVLKRNYSPNETLKRSCRKHSEFLMMMTRGR
jgi:Ca2+-binding EF-hand superfamily protein